MKKTILFLSKTSTILISFTIFLILCILSNTVFQCDFKYLTQTFHYSAGDAYSLLSTIGASGRTSHLLILLSDICMTILYSMFLLGLLYRLSITLTTDCHMITLLTFLPLLLTLAQFTEIILLAVMIINYSSPSAILATITSHVTCIKTILTPIMFLLPLILFGVRIIVKKSKRMIRNESEC